MLIRAGTVARVEFQSELSGQLVALTNPAAIIYRGVIATSLVAAIANPSVGIYYASFDVPVDWQNYDFVSCQLTGSINGMAIARIKAVGVVLDPLLATDARLNTLIPTLATADRIEQLTAGRYAIANGILTFYGVDNVTVLRQYHLRKNGVLVDTASVDIDERRVI